MLATASSSAQPWPMRPVMRAAPLRSPVSFQKTACTIWLPSSGKAGIMLTASTSTFSASTTLSQTATGAVCTGSAARTCEKWSLAGSEAPATADAAITASVTAGPAAATRNCAPGPAGAPVVRVIPPSAHSSIPSTFRPLRRATSAWPSSCRISERKNDSTLATATM